MPVKIRKYKRAANKTGASGNSILQGISRHCPFSASVWLAGGLGSRQCSLVVRMIPDFLDVLDIADHIILVDHKNGTAENAQILDQGSVSLAERPGSMVRHHFD